jgi:hypothetical protein
MYRIFGETPTKVPAAHARSRVPAFQCPRLLAGFMPEIPTKMRGCGDPASTIYANLLNKLLNGEEKCD